MQVQIKVYVYMQNLLLSFIPITQYGSHHIIFPVHLMQMLFFLLVQNYLAKDVPRENMSEQT